MQFGAIIEKGLVDWQIVQQTNGYADIELFGSWIPSPEIRDDAASVYVRVIKEDDGDIVLWWNKSEDLDDRKWRIALKNVPAGGTYRIETCLMGVDMPCIEYARRGDMLHHIGVGDLYVIAGQSNAAGYGKGSSYDPPEIGVHLLKNSGKWDLATHPFNDSTNSIHNENTEDTNSGHSPYLSFAKMLKRELSYPVGLIQTARGGSSFARWSPNEVGDLYHCMLNVIRSQGGKIKGVLWYQGCTDAIERNAENYLERFKNMVVELCAELDIGNIPFLTVQLNRHTDQKKISDDRDWGLIREAQRQAAMKIPNVFVMPSTDCRLSDGIHNSSAANVMLGERLAKAALFGIYKKAVLYAAPNIVKAQKIGKGIIKLIFENVFDRLFFYDLPANELPFTVEDKDGIIMISSYTANKNEIDLRLERDGINMIVHGAFVANPSYLIPVDTSTQLPMLSFYNVLIYAELLMNGELMPLMHKVNDEAYEQVEQIMCKSIKQYKDNSTDTMLNLKRRNTAQAIAEEIVIKDFVLLPR